MSIFDHIPKDTITAFPYLTCSKCGVKIIELCKGDVCHKCHLEIEHETEEGNCQTKKWAKNYDRCTVCKKTDIMHLGKGMCKRCYRKKYHEKYSK